MKIAVGLILLTSLSIAACSKTDDTSTLPPPPATVPPAAEVAPEAPAESAAPAVVPAEPAEQVAAAAPAVSAQPTPGKPEPVKPVPSKPEPAKPAAKPPVAAPSEPKPDLAHGQQIYQKSCAFCHDKGVAGAPKLGDAAAWTPRMTQGMDALYASATRGKGAMPAKGGNPSLGDADIKAAVDYLVAQSR